MNLKPGDRVRLKKEWQDAGEESFEWIIVEWNGDRGLVQLADCFPSWPKMAEGCDSFPMQTLITSQMIESA